MFSIQGYILRSMDRSITITVYALSIKEAQKIGKEKTGVDMYFRGYAD